MDIPSVFSIIFSVACAISLFLGIYILHLNPNSKTNRLFFVVTIALDFWAFGFSMAVSADNMAAVLFWRRFSALGFGSFFSVLLHFFHVYTGKGNTEKTRWMNLLIYIPAVVTFLGFTYFPSINPDQYNMVQTHLGWINVAVNNGWDWFYMAYYIGYSLAGYFMVWQWGRKSRNIRTKKQAYLILFSFLVTMLLGSLTDILGNMIFSEAIPQLAPLLMIFPIVIIFYTIKKFGFMNPKHVDEEAILMTDQIRSKVVNYTANAFLAAGILNFIALYLLFDNADLISVLIFSGSLILIGFLLQAIQRSLKNNDIKDILNAVIISVVVPIITLRFIDYSGVTVWAFPFILLIITLIFGKSYIQITLTISIILTQIIVWLIKPETIVKIDAVDHVIRIGMFAIAIWFAFFVKKLYTSKLNENTAQISIQKLITEISSDFVSVNEGNLDEKANRNLMKLGSFAKADRVYIYLLDDDNELLRRKYIWLDDSKPTSTIMPEIVNVSSFPVTALHLAGGNIIAAADITDTLPEFGDELLQLISSRDKSLVVIPIIINTVFFGVIAVEAERKAKRWHETQLGFYKIISNIYTDAFERINRDKAINFMAFYDHLTRLPNRLLFKDRVAQAINLTGRSDKILSVVFLDLDAFKTVNDSIGHDGGDSLLVKVSEKLSKLLRKSDSVSRFGGDEFLLLLNHLNSTGDIVKIIEKILSIFDKPFILNEQEFYVTASVGVAVYPYDGEDADALIRNADIAMYKAKEQGKNRYLFCTSDMKDELVLKMKLSNSLFRALEQHEFLLNYQPQVSIETRKIIGAEALIRWDHPDIGMIAPGLFIPLAEQTGLIGPIGDWVLMTACLQCKSWQIEGLDDIRIAVNVSILQLRNPDFVYRVGQILEETQLEPRCLELEITESAAVNESDYIIEVLGGLKKLGISISIDDFGTEYSSLSRLTTMPIDRVKLDMKFIQGISRSEKEKSIIRGIIGLVHSLDLKVIAEGVETEDQLDFLREKNCDEIQGYFFYRPLDPDTLGKILRDNT